MAREQVVQPAHSAVAAMSAMSGVRLSIGGVRPGWYSIDNRGGNDADCVWDLECYPWPLPDSCAVEVYAGHVVNRINPARFGFVLFMNELWRLLVPNGELILTTYYGTNGRYCADPAACNAVTEATFYLFRPGAQVGIVAGVSAAAVGDFGFGLGGGRQLGGAAWQAIDTTG